MSELPLLPANIKELEYEGIQDGLDLLNRFKAYVIKPCRPTVDRMPDSAKLIELAQQMSAYEADMVEYELDKKDVRLHNMKVDTLVNQLICAESGLDRVPEQYRNKIFSKAWSDRSSDGGYAVYQQLVELVEIFE